MRWPAGFSKPMFHPNELWIRHINMNLEELMQLEVGDHMQMLNRCNRFRHVLVVTLRSASCNTSRRATAVILLVSNTKKQMNERRHEMFLVLRFGPLSNRLHMNWIEYGCTRAHWQPCYQMSPFKISQRLGFILGDRLQSTSWNSMTSIWLPLPAAKCFRQ